MAFARRLRGNIIACSNGAEGWVVGVGAIDGDVPAGTKPCGVVSLGR